MAAEQEQRTYTDEDIWRVWLFGFSSGVSTSMINFASMPETYADVVADMLTAEVKGDPAWAHETKESALKAARGVEDSDGDMTIKAAPCADPNCPECAP